MPKEKAARSRCHGKNAENEFFKPKVKKTRKATEQKVAHQKEKFTQTLI